MASDATQLVVRLEAKLDQFERGLKQAGVIADGQAKEIEDRFSKLNPSMTWATTAGDLIGRGISTGLKFAIDALTDFIERMKALPDIAKRTGVSVQDVFALQSVVGKDGGLTPEKVNKGLDELGEKLNDARREANELSKLFELNGKQIKDAAGNAIPLQQALATVADLVRGASSEFDKVKIAEIAGLTKEWVKSLEGGASSLDYARQKAAEAAPDLQAMIDKARDFDDAWKEASKNFGTYFKSTAIDVLNDVKQLIAFVKSIDWKGGLTAPMDIATSAERERLASMRQVVGSMARSSGDAPSLPASAVDARAPLPPARPSGFGTTTKIPTKDKGGGGGSESLDSFEREERRAKEMAERLAEETRSIDLNTEARAKNAEVLRLKQMLEREGLPLTDETMAKIDATASKLAKATAALEEAREAQRRSLELQNFVGGELINILDQISQRGAKAADVMRNLASTLARALMQAAILGQGPLAGLFGTSSSTPGSAGGLVGLFNMGLKALPAFAEGTPFAPGGLALVGERGPELVNLPRGAQVMPNYAIPSMMSGRSGSPIINITSSVDARGSTMGPGELKAALDARDRQIRAQLAPMVRDLARRGRL